VKIKLPSPLISQRLPLSVETDGLICYNEPVPDLTCDPLTPVLGDLHRDSDGLHPNTDQCFKLLKAEWPYVMYWFHEIFPDFTPPDPSSDQEKYMLKTVLWLWILRYGASEIKSDPLWQDIVATFNSASLDWAKLLAWAGDIIGYSPDGVNTLTFPAVLETSLTQTSPEMQLFNHFSTLCNSQCSLGVQCQQISASNTCS
jgi:hypothetical protein